MLFDTIFIYSFPAIAMYTLKKIIKIKYVPRVII